MKIVTKQEKVAESIKAFFYNYPQYNSSNAPFYTRERYNKMLTLNPDTCTPAQLNEVIGNESWTDNICYECGTDNDILAFFDVMNESELCLCENCISAALKMISNK